MIWRAVRGTAVNVFGATVAVAVDLALWGGSGWEVDGFAVPFWLVPAVAVVLYLALLRRDTQPFTAFLVQWIAAVATLMVPAYLPFACLLLALHAVAARRRLPVAAAALALCLLLFALDSVAVAVGNPGNSFLRTVVLAGLLFYAAAAGAWGLGRHSYRVEHRARLFERRARLVEEVHAERTEEAIRSERLQLARELHDIVTHAVIAMLTNAAGARALSTAADPRVVRALGHIETAGAQALEELRRLLGIMRVAGGPDHVGTGHQPGLDDLPGLVETARTSGVAVTFTTEGQEVPLDRSVDLAAYRVIQEAITNTLKYGVGASAIDIRLRWSAQQVVIVARTVRADATDAADPRPVSVPPSSGYGLIGLAERVTLVGGRLSAGPDGDGFVVCAELPAQKADVGPIHPLLDPPATSAG